MLSLNMIAGFYRMKCNRFYCDFSTRGIQILRTIDEVRSLKSSLNKNNETLGFVPTMGALHSGHLKLMEIAKSTNNKVITSIFVNPSQFSAGEDLDKYPRTLEKDISMLESINVDYVYTPKESDIYPKPPNNMVCHIEPTSFNSIYEGVARPEFFRGVATIVCKLFNIVQPTSAYFGQKDISQCLLIKCLVRDLNLPVDIKIIETVREHDGLAMSSRNTYLTPTERQSANVLYRALIQGKLLCTNSSKTTANSQIDRNSILKTIETSLKSEKCVKSIDYISIANQTDMNEIDFVKPTDGAIISCAIKFGESENTVRLIDNLLIGSAEDILYHHSK